jgi:hypothetical protein
MMFYDLAYALPNTNIVCRMTRQHPFTNSNHIGYSHSSSGDSKSLWHRVSPILSNSHEQNHQRISLPFSSTPPSPLPLPSPSPSALCVPQQPPQIVLTGQIRQTVQTRQNETDADPAYLLPCYVRGKRGEGICSETVNFTSSASN